jgi:acetyltransferase-like isoleucine patch superfamily enzyme
MGFIRNLLKRFDEDASAGRRSVDDPAARWSRLLEGRCSIGAGTRIGAAQLTVRNPSGCRLSIGADSNIEAVIVLEAQRAEVRIGSRCHLGGGAIVDAACGIEIGDDVLIAFEVLIMDHDSHALRFDHRRHDVQNWMNATKDWTHVTRRPVHIGDKAWLGARTIVLKGVTIGEGSVTGAGSVVTRDVPAWTMVAGNPARIIRRLTEEERGNL